IWLLLPVPCACGGTTHVGRLGRLCSLQALCGMVSPTTEHAPGRALVWGVSRELATCRCIVIEGDRPCVAASLGAASGVPCMGPGAADSRWGYWSSSGS